MNKASVIIYGWMSPHLIRKRKWLEYYNEVMVMLLSYSMLCMTSFMLDDKVVFNFGYVFITLFGVLIVGNFVYISNILLERYFRQKRLSNFKDKYVEFYEN